MDRNNREIAMPKGVTTPTEGAEITIPNVDFGDEGRYRCTATGQYGDPASEMFQLIVECKNIYIYIYIGSTRNV